MAAYVLALSLVFLGCNSKQSVNSADSHEPHIDAKHVASYNPFLGLDEDGYAERIGNPEAVRQFLDVLAAKLSAMMNNPDLREELAECLNDTPERDVNLAEAALSHPAILEALSVGFKQTVSSKGISGGELSADALMDATSDMDAVLIVSEGLFGLRLRVRGPNDQVLNWDGTNPLPVFSNPITDELDTELVNGYNPDGTTSTYAFGSRPPYQILYLFQDEAFFDRPGNEPDTETALMEYPQSISLFSLFSELVFPKAAFAAPQSCGDQAQLWLRQIKIYNTHESNEGNPEIYLRTGGVILEGWVERQAKKCNVVGFLYKESNSDWLPLRVYPVSGEYCQEIRSLIIMPWLTIKSKKVISGLIPMTK